jgi:hypothetical protein
MRSKAAKAGEKGGEERVREEGRRCQGREGERVEIVGGDATQKVGALTVFQLVLLIIEGANGRFV